MSRRSSTTLHAASRLARARDELHKSRMALASSTVPGDVHVVDPRWRWAARLLQQRRPALLAINGVVAAELGHRVRKGILTHEPCVTVFVTQKLSAPELRQQQRRALPKFIRSGKRRLAVDVVALGKLDRHASAGSSIGPSNDARTGTLGAFATEDASGRTVAITAMHVSGFEDIPPSAPIGFSSPSLQDDPAASTPFAVLTQGTMHGIDAAKLDLNLQTPPVTTLPDGRTIAGWRPTTFPGDRGTVVQMYGARSGLVVGFVVNPFVPIPGWDLDGAILVNIGSRRGDSGAALIDSSDLLLGFLVGAAGAELDNLRIFVPAGLVLAKLGCDIATAQDS